MLMFKAWTFAAVAVLWSSVTPVPAANGGWFEQATVFFSQLISQNTKSPERDWHRTVATVQAIPEDVRPGSVAATVSAEGHWTFANSRGELFTAANDREITSMTDVLFPDGVGATGLTVYLTPASVFQHRDQLKNLPAGARLRLVISGRNYPVQISKNRDGTGHSLVARVRPDVVLAITKRAVFEELLWQLEQPLVAYKVRVLSIVSNGPAALPALRPKRSDTDKLVIEPISPQHVTASLATLSQQLAVLTGRISGKNLIIRVQNGKEITLDFAAMRKAAASNDVGLVLLNSKAPRQPGARNWLFLEVGVDGLAEALKRATLADFIGSLALSAGTVDVRGEILSASRVRLLIAPTPTGFTVSTDGLVGLIAELASEVAGTVLPGTLQLDMNSRARTQELAWRLLPGVPAAAQLGMIVLTFFSLFAIKTTRRWWQAVWPSEEREEYASWLGYQAARCVRLIAFAVLFLPIAGLPALTLLILQALFRLVAPTPTRL